MSDSEETLKQENEVLKAIADLSAKLDERFNKIESRLNSHDAQFEAIRQGLVDNAIRFDRFEAEFYKVRSDISNLKADIKELTRKELV